MSEPEVLTEVDGNVLVVTINRPDAKNAMNKAAAEGISAAMDRLDAEAGLQVAILTGAGGTFCSGMDLKGFLRGESPSLPGRGFGGLSQWTPKKPIIAAVDGYALAGGLIKLPRQIPPRIAMELALTGDFIDAARAYELGFINRVVEGPSLPAAKELAARIAENGPLALAASKAIVRDSHEWTEADMWDKQQAYITPVFTSQDAREGAAAFAEKRKPNWQGK